MATREQSNEAARRYRARHPERVAESNKAYKAKHPVETQAIIKAWTSRNPERVRVSRLKQRYGITGEKYDEMLAAQGGACAICRAPQGDSQYKRLYVDHCHASGTIRGLLCMACNVGIARFGDDPNTLRAAILYLEESA